MATSIETKLTLYSLATSRAKTCVAFLTTWCNVIYDLEHITDFQLPDHQKIVCLKSAVRLHPQLKLFLGNVQLYSCTHVGKSANDSDFEYIYDLMLEHATDIDHTDLEDGKTPESQGTVALNDWDAPSVDEEDALSADEKVSFLLWIHSMP
jgi:hypothetical protein